MTGAAGSYAGRALQQAQSGAFEVIFDVTPLGAPVEAGLALAAGAQSGLDWPDLATIVRFNPSGKVDARNGDAYAAATAVPYLAGATYRVRQVVDVAHHVYSVFVTPPAEGETVLGQGYAFRTQQQSVTSLAQWGIRSDSGALRACLVSIKPVTAPPPSSSKYPFQGYTTTHGGFQAPLDGGVSPRILIVDRLGASSSDGDETTGRGSLPWALSRSFPRVILFEISGVISVGGTISVTAPYVSVHGQTAPAPGVTISNVELLISTHDVIVQHLRVRMGQTKIGGGDPMSICGSKSRAVEDIVIDHCSVGLGHDEQLSISACGAGDVRRVTLSNNLLAFGLHYGTGHSFGTLIDSGDSNAFDVDEILVEGTLYSQLSFRTPMVNHAARRVTVANNVTYNALYYGMRVSSAQYPEGQYVDMINNLYWRGPETYVAGMWPTSEASTWPAQPDLWTWDPNRRWVGSFSGPTGNNTHVFYANNYDYVNNTSYAAGKHEGRPVSIAHDWFNGTITPKDVTATTRQTSAKVVLMTPIELEDHVKNAVGCTPKGRDPLDTLAVKQAFDRTGGYIQSVSALSVQPLPSGSATRTLTSITGYPAGSELDDADKDGLTNLEEWIYAL